MVYKDAIDICKMHSSSRIRRSSWERGIFVKYVRDGKASRGSLGVGIRPFLAITNNSDMAYSVYIPTEEDMTSGDWQEI